jgi:hypothetical protein
LTRGVAEGKSPLYESYQQLGSLVEVIASSLVTCRKPD